jgi:Uma2 family endonuclease
MASEPAKRVELRYEVPVSSPHWTLDDDEERMPENPLQVAICDLLKLILVAWCRRRDADALVSGNVALRWDPLHPKVGVDPDVYLVEPSPPLGHKSKSLRTWVKGHSPPRVAVEVVSDATADVDYNVKPAKYAASRTRELWIFDPLMVGPRGGDAVRVQVWRREARRGFRRVYAGDGPARSEELGAWLVVTDGGERLRIADHADGTGLWLTGEEEARARAEEARAREEEARAAKDAALAEVERLRAELARVSGGSPSGTSV